MRWRLYKRLRRAGYSESEALDQAQITKTCCRFTVSQQTESSSKVVAAGRPVTGESGKRTVRDILKFPKPETFPIRGKVNDSTPPSETGTITFEVLEGTIMFERFEHSTEEEVPPQARGSFEGPNSGSRQMRRALPIPAVVPSGESMGGVLLKRAPGRRRARVEGSGGTFRRGATIPRQIIEAKPIEQIASGVSLQSPQWNNIAWELGSEGVISSFASEEFELPIKPEMKTLQIYVEVWRAIKTPIEWTNEDPITGIEIFNGLNEFVNVPLDREILLTLVRNDAFSPVSPRIVWFVALSLQTSIRPSLRDVRLGSGLSMRLREFKPFRVPGSRQKSGIFRAIFQPRTTKPESAADLALTRMFVSTKITAIQDDTVFDLEGGESNRFSASSAVILGNNIIRANFQFIVGTTIKGAFYSEIDLEDTLGIAGKPVVFVLSDSSVLVAGSAVTIGSKTFPIVME